MPQQAERHAPDEPAKQKVYQKKEEKKQQKARAEAAAEKKAAAARAAAEKKAALNEVWQRLLHPKKDIFWWVDTSNYLANLKPTNSSVFFQNLVFFVLFLYTSGFVRKTRVFSKNLCFHSLKIF